MAMKELIKEFREKNGNNSFTVKEIVQALSTKQEKFENYVHDKFESGTGKIGANTTRSKMNFKLNIVIIIAVVLNVASRVFWG